MTALITQLESQSILTNDQVKRIRDYIAQKYSDDKRLRAQVFAGAVHQILSRNLLCLESALRDAVQYRVLQRTVERKVFQINGDDVFNGIVESIEAREDQFFALSAWLSSIQIHISLEELVAYFEPPATLPMILPTNNFEAVLPQRTWYHVLKHYALIMGIVLLAVQIAHPETLERDIIDGGSLPIGIIEEITGNLDRFMLGTQAVAIAAPKAATKAVTKAAESPKPASASKVKANTSTKISTSSKTRIGYRHVNLNTLSTWLHRKNSLLGEMTYLKVITETARAHNIDPLLLVAITGQEQSFVPRSHPESKIMVNNPFNVYGSWRKYNTSLKQATEVACHTLIRLVAGCPEHIDPVRWINRRYASDPNWAGAVRQLMSALEKTPGIFEE